MAPQLHTALPGGGQERRGGGLHSHLSLIQNFGGPGHGGGVVEKCRNA